MDLLKIAWTRFSTNLQASFETMALRSVRDLPPSRSIGSDVVGFPQLTGHEGIRVVIVAGTYVSIPRPNESIGRQERPVETVTYEKC